MKINWVLFRCFWLFSLILLSVGVSAQGLYLNRLPNNAVNAMVEDKDGFLWIGTSHGLSRFDGFNYLTFYAQNIDDALVNDAIQALMCDEQGRVWISTECGLCVYENGHFRHPEHTSFNLKPRLLDIDERTLLAADRQGIVLIEKETLREIRSYPLPREQWPFIKFKATTQQIWVICPLPSRNQTEIYIFDKHLNLLRTMMVVDVITEIQVDSNEQVWGLANGGVFNFDTNKIQLRKLPQTLQDLCRNNNVDFLSMGKDDSFLLGIRDYGIYRYNIEKQEAEAFIAHRWNSQTSWTVYQSSKGTFWMSDQKSFFQSFPRSSHYQSVQLDDYPLTILPDNQGQVWFRSAERLYCMNTETHEVAVVMKGVFGEFLIDKDDKLYLVDSSNHLDVYQIKGQHLEPYAEYAMSTNILSVCRDSQERIWIATSKSLGVIDENGELILMSTPDNVTITALYEALPAHEVMMTTVNGVVYRLKGDQFEPFELPVKNPSAFYYNADSSEMIIGSYNEGATFYNLKTGRTTTYTSEDNLGDNHVKTIIADRDGNIWFGGATSISRLDLADSTIIQIHDSNHGGGALYAGSCIDQNNTLYFAGSGGLAIVQPDLLKLQYKPSQVNIILETLGVNGETFDNVNQTSFHFDYDENMLLFRFIAIDLENGDHIRYEYMLEGHDTRWIPSGASRRASYSQLPAGKYVFRVRARLESGDWSENELAIPITIATAPWNSWWAKCIYLLTILGMFVLGLRLFIRWRLQQERLSLLYNREAMKQEHIDFMTNLSHEIRTPLMLIYAPLKELQQDFSISEQSRNLIQLILHNAEKLKLLINQIMTTNQAGTRETLHVAESRLDYLVYSMVDNFRFVAAAKQLHLRAGEVTPDAKGWYDTEVVEKILSNFLSNAIKYTPAGGEIIVELKMQDDGKVCIRVLDDGPGIPAEQQYKIFDRYWRMNTPNDVSQAAGHGIGLNYSHFLSRLHKGDIVYEQRKPHGSIFSLIIPVIKESYSEEELSYNADVLIWNENTLQPTWEDNNSETKEKTILVAEDNPAVLKYLQHLLSKEYNVVLTADGEEALQAMELGLPDLVITDVVMPHKDGFELCRSIKQDENLQLIPVLMLTAKSESEYHLQGLDNGADAFLAKPFDPEILLRTVRNMLNVRNKLQHLLRNTTSQTLTDLKTDEVEGVSEQPVLPERDRQFLEELYKAIDAHLSENEFNVNELARELLVSYSLLYNKVKGLTGETPQHFLTTYRMNRAMEMLKSRKYTVSEVCYQVGASSPANFSKAFKKQFGVSPSSVLQ